MFSSVMKNTLSVDLYSYQPNSMSSNLWNRFVRDSVLWLRAHSHEGVDILREPTRGVMVLVEPRLHPYLEFVILNFAHVLARFGWGLQIFHGTRNEAFLKELCSKWKGTVLLNNLGVENLSNAEYNRLLVSRAFWESVSHENVITFQTDTMMFHARGLGQDDDWRFLNYAYVGAPWGAEFCKPRKDPRTAFVGNGGLSFRKRSAMFACCDAMVRKCDARTTDEMRVVVKDMHEDAFFVYACQHLDLPIASTVEACRFSIEYKQPGTTFSESRPCGCHKSYAVMPESELLRLLDIREWFRADEPIVDDTAPVASAST